MLQLKSGDLFARRYRIIRLLGEGGMAYVYLVEHTSLGRQYALKVLKWQMSGKEALRQRLKKEAVAMERAQHGNIVAVHDLDEHEGQIYIIMDFVSGGSLRDLQRRKAYIPSREAASIVMDVLRGLECAHNNGIVHRDVKPDNVLLGADGVPKICDFGIARASGESHGFTQTGGIIGTFWYMAPEQQWSSVRTDLRADLYATGVMLHALIAGIVKPTAPFFYSTLHEDPDIMDPIPDVLRPIICKATAHQPQNRYASAMEMIEAIESVLNQLPTVSEESETRRVSFHTMVPEIEGEVIGTRFDFSSSSSNADGQVSSEHEVAPPVVVSVAVEPRRERLPHGGMIAIVGTVTLVISLLVYGFWMRDPRSPPVQAWQAYPEAITSSRIESVAEPTASPVDEPVTSVIGLSSEKDRGKVVGKNDPKTKATKVEPRVKAVQPSVAVEQLETRATVRGDATQVRLIGDNGSFTLPTSIPPGFYRVTATFQDTPDPVTVIRQIEVKDKPVVIVCDSAFARCNRE